MWSWRCPRRTPKRVERRCARSTKEASGFKNHANWFQCVIISPFKVSLKLLNRTINHIFLIYRKRSYSLVEGSGSALSLALVYLPILLVHQIIAEIIVFAGSVSENIIIEENKIVTHRLLLIFFIQSCLMSDIDPPLPPYSTGRTSFGTCSLRVSESGKWKWICERDNIVKVGWYLTKRQVYN